MSKIDYQKLANKTGDKTVATFTTLANQFNTTEIKISQILKDAGLKPVGKIPKTDSSGNMKVGKPALAFDLNAATKAVSDVLVVPTEKVA